MIVDERELRLVAKNLPRSILEPEHTNILLTTSNRNTVSMHKDWVNTQRVGFEDYIKRNKKKL